MVDFIEVLRGPEAAYYGTRASNGVIIINTHRVSNFRNKIEGYGTLQYYPRSYHMASNFIVPEYDNLNIKNGNFKDNRSTIYWNGHTYTNEKGKANIQFDTADNANSYTIQIVGLTATGDIIYKKQKFKCSSPKLYNYDLFVVCFFLKSRLLKKVNFIASIDLYLSLLGRC